jgi:thiol-disulfide isomerase/thioredoxin
MVSGAVWTHEPPEKELDMKHRAFIFLIVCFALTNAHSAMAVDLNLTGNRLIDFRLETLAGETVNLLDVIKEKTFFIVLTTTWCGDCKRLKKVMENIIPRYGQKEISFCFIYVGQNVKMVIASENDPGKESRSVVRLADSKWEIINKLKLTAVPYIVIVDKKAVVKFDGFSLNKKFIVSEIEKVLNTTVKPDQ